MRSDLWTKLGKLRGAPERFFADSKSPVLRVLGRLAAPVLRAELTRELLDDPVDVARRVPVARDLVELYDQRAARRRARVLEQAGSQAVSVVIAAHDAEPWIEKAIRSLLAQTYAHLEILVVDDASRDRTAAVVEAMASPKVRLIRNPTQRGAAASRNRGLSEAKGAYVTFQDADDVSHPERIERQLAALFDRRDAVVCICNFVRLSPEGQRMTINGRRTARSVISMLFARELVLSRLGYMLDLTVAEDTEYYERISAVFGRRRTVRLRDELYLAQFTPGSLLFSQGATQHDGLSIDFTRSERAEAIVAEVNERIAQIRAGALDPYVPLDTPPRR